jgi:hypothetical protein
MADKKYTSRTRRVAARPRAERLRKLGTATASASVSIVSAEGSRVQSVPSSSTSHTHANKSDLDRLSISTDDYLLIQGTEDKAKAKSGYSDESAHSVASDKAALADNSTQWEGHDFGDYVDQPVRKGDDVSFGSVKLGVSAGSADFSTGIVGGKGWQAWMDAMGKSHLEIDNLMVRAKAHFFKLVIDEMKSAGGSLILTPANGFVTEKVIHTDGDTHYKLLWKASDGQKSITNMWMEGDQAICMTDNLAAGTTYNASNRFWWVLVTDAGATTVDGTRYNYITVNFDRSAGAGAVSAGTPADIVPKVGDNVAMLGSRATDKDSGEVLTDRQNAVYIAAHGSLDTGLTAPFMAFYRGITTFDLKKYRKTYFAPNSSAVIANNFLMAGDDYEAPVSVYLGPWTTGMTVPYGGVVSYNGRTWTCINPKGADGIEPTKQATAYWASNKGDSYDIVFSLNGVHVDTLNYDDVKAVESASLQVEFYNDGDPYTAAKATITCYDASGAVLGSPIELSDTTSDIIDGGNLYLSKDCKQITAVAYDAAGRQVVSKSLGVVRNGVDGTELVSLMLKVISGHTSWRAGQGTIATVAAYAMKGGYDITDAQDVSQFIWTRDSSDTTGDKNWNSQHTTGSKTLSVAEGDMVGDFTTFVCTLYNKNGKVVEVQKLDFQL